MNNKILFLDLETTGFSREWDYIIEVAGIMYDEDSDTEDDQFQEYIKPNKKIPPQITALTGISNDTVRGCRNEIQVLQDFSEWRAINNPNIIIGHNCKAFDLGFIRQKCLKYGITWREDNVEVIDTLTMARQLNKAGKIITENCKQPTLAEYFNIQYEAHSAEEDVRALIEIYKKMKELANPSAAATRADLGF